jgi:hypothetical protein
VTSCAQMALRCSSQLDWAIWLMPTTKSVSRQSGGFVRRSKPLCLRNEKPKLMGLLHKSCPTDFFISYCLHKGGVELLASAPRITGSILVVSILVVSIRERWGKYTVDENRFQRSFE